MTRSTNKHSLAHIGGFLMGVLVGTTFYPVISTSRRHKLIMWGFRLAAIPLAVILYVLLVRNFYTSNPYAGELPTLSHSYACSYDFQHVLGVDTCRAFRGLLIIIAKGTRIIIICSSDCAYPYTFLV